HLHELFARQRERELVGAVAVAAGASPAAAVAALRAGQPVAGLEVPVAGVDVLVVAAGTVPEHGFRDVPGRDADLAAALHVPDRAVGDHVVHRAPDLRAVTAHETLAIDRAAAAVVRPAIDDHRHGLLAYCDLRTRRYHSQSRRTCFSV